MSKSIVAIHPVDFLDELIEFRSERLKVISDRKPITLEEGAKVVLHLIPTDALDQRQVVNLVSLKNSLRPLFVGGTCRFNFDGLLSYSTGTNNIRSYVQLFHSGVVEAVYVFAERNDKKVIPSAALGRNLIEAIQSYLTIQQSLEVKLPVTCLLTLVGVNGFQLAVGERAWSYDSFPIDRDILLFPELLFESFDIAVDREMRPLFNRLWNAAGLRVCLHYDEQGRWVDQ